MAASGWFTARGGKSALATACIVATLLLDASGFLFFCARGLLAYLQPVVHRHVITTMNARGQTILWTVADCPFEHSHGRLRDRFAAHSRGVLVPPVTSASVSSAVG